MNNKLSLSVIIEDEIFVFPFMVVNIFVYDKQSISIVEQAIDNNETLLLVCTNNQQEQRINFYDVGIVGKAMRKTFLPDGRVRVLFQGISKARIEKIISKNPIRAEVSVIHYKEYNKTKVKALLNVFLEKVKAFAHINQSFPIEVLKNAKNSDDPNRIVDTVIAHLKVKKDQNYKLLLSDDTEERIVFATQLIIEEIENQRLQKDIKSKVNNKLEKINKDFFLREQLKQIQKELGVDNQRNEEIIKYETKLEKLKPFMDESAYKEVKKQIDRLSRSHPDSSDSNLIQNYVEWMLEIPFDKISNNKLSIKNVEKQLNSDHYSLEEPKERIIEYFAIKQLIEQRDIEQRDGEKTEQKDEEKVESKIKTKKTKKVSNIKHKGTILCFYGPPGIGKTSLANSIAIAINRPLIRVALGGLEDVNELRGHRRTYIGAMPGRIVQGLIDSKKMNPVMVLDEIDKVARGVRGDPTSVLLEILDPEQNVSFRDYYANFSIDLSQIVFIATANDISLIPPPLRDRMEFIEISSYTPQEKFQIAQKYLIPQELNNHALNSNELKFNKDAIEMIIHNYTREAGVRNLRRKIATIMRKVAVKFLNKEADKIIITPQELPHYLKKTVFEIEKSTLKPRIGVVNGLAWTSVGGDVLKIEVISLLGKGDLKITGQLGDIMKESAFIAYSVVKDRLDNKSGLKKLLPEMKFEEENNNKRIGSITEKLNIHIHVPEGATPKDGPSAGITIACAIASLLFSKKAKQDVAMTGELNLSGDVLPIGGLREKLIAAYKAEIKTAFIPEKNYKRDLQDIPEEVIKNINIVPVANIDEVFKHTLIDYE